MVTVQRTVPIILYIPRGDGCDPRCQCVKCAASRAAVKGVVRDIRQCRSAKRSIASSLFLLQAAGCEFYQDGEYLNFRTARKLGIPSVDQKTGKQKVTKKGEPAFVPDWTALAKYVFGENTKGGNGLREYVRTALLPGFDSGVIDSSLQHTISVWTSKDPDIQNAQRDWLALNFVRSVPQFLHSPMPIRHYTLGEHDITLRWKTGENVKFKVGTLDGSRWHTWTKILQGQDSLAKFLKTGMKQSDAEEKVLSQGGFLGADPITLNYDEGKNGIELRLVVAYKRPPETERDLDPRRVLEGNMTDDRNAYVKFKIRQGHETLTDDMRRESLSAASIVQKLDELFAQQERWKEARGACGNKRERKDGTGHKKAWQSAVDHSASVTRNRERICEGWNHTWTSRIVAVAKRWRCKKILILNRPETLLKRPWGWAQFEFQLKYKCQDAGIDLEITRTKDDDGPPEGRVVKSEKTLVAERS